MEDRTSQQKPATRWLFSQMQTKGLRPRFAAYWMAAIWMVAVIAFGAVEHLIDPDTFPNVWLGMWWALQTVTTVGYGDAVPAEPPGRWWRRFCCWAGSRFWQW